MVHSAPIGNQDLQGGSVDPKECCHSCCLEGNDDTANDQPIDDELKI